MKEAVMKVGIGFLMLCGTALIAFLLIVGLKAAVGDFGGLRS